jgi:hypothetical protein
MANICSYKIKVKGKKNACYAFMGSTSAYDARDILLEAGTAEDFVLIFKGTCKWGIDMYCHNFEGKKPVILPKNFEDALAEAEDKYWYHTVQERSEMFNVEVWCNSGDADDIGDLVDIAEELGISLEEMDLHIMCYEHYVNGEEVNDECPEELYLNVSLDDYDEQDDIDDFE